MSLQLSFLNYMQRMTLGQIGGNSDTTFYFNHYLNCSFGSSQPVLQMPFEKIEWISAQLQGADIAFPNDTIWRLETVLAEKDMFCDEGPAEASAVFTCNQQSGPNLGCEALIRVRIQ
jgi:hypothetical protein